MHLTYMLRGRKKGQESGDWPAAVTFSIDAIPFAIKYKRLYHIREKYNSIGAETKKTKKKPAPTEMWISWASVSHLFPLLLSCV